MRAKYKTSYSVGDPESDDVFQLSYFVDVAFIDDERGELPGVNTYVFEIVSPRWIEERLNSSRIMLGRHFIISLTSDLDLVEAKLGDYVETFSGATATELNQKLEKIGRSDGSDNYPLEDTYFL